MLFSSSASFDVQTLRTSVLLSKASTTRRWSSREICLSATNDDRRIASVLPHSEYFIRRICRNIFDYAVKKEVVLKNPCSEALSVSQPATFLQTCSAEQWKHLFTAILESRYSSTYPPGYATILIIIAAMGLNYQYGGALYGNQTRPIP
jgi:hypothetical protein